jgi:hypothetical protein
LEITPTSNQAAGGLSAKATDSASPESGHGDNLVPEPLVLPPYTADSGAGGAAAAGEVPDPGLHLAHPGLGGVFDHLTPIDAPADVQAPQGMLTGTLADTIVLSNNTLLQLFGEYGSGGELVNNRVRYFRTSEEGTVLRDQMLYEHSVIH